MLLSEAVDKDLSEDLLFVHQRRRILTVQQRHTEGNRKAATIF